MDDNTCKTKIIKLTYMISNIYKHKMKPFNECMPKVFSYDFAMFLTVLFFGLFFFFVGYTRHYGYLTSINDLGHFDQAVWGASKYGALINSDIFNTRINRLGVHFDLILYAFSPLYKILPSATWLILAQSICASIAAWPIFLFAKKVCLSSKSAFLWGLIFLCNPFLQNAVAWDFHPVTLALPFISSAIFFLYEKRFFPVIISSIFILLCKEHFGLMVVGIGFLWYIRHHELSKSIFLIFMGGLHFLLVFKYFMPYFSPTGEHLMLCKNLGQLSRYTWLGESLTDIILSICKNPYKVFHVAMIEMGGIRYLIMLLLPFCGYPLLGLSFLIPALGDLAANLLSANQMPKSVFAYHSVTMIPLFCTSAILGCKKVSKISTNRSCTQISGYIFMTTILTCYLFSPFPLPKSSNFWAPKSFFNFNDSTLAEIKTLIPLSSSVSAQANIGAHFTQRDWIFSFPNKVGEVDIIVLRIDSPTMNLTPNNPTYIGTLSHHLQMQPRTYLDSILNVLSENQYGIVFWKNNWLVLKKNHPDILPSNLVKERVLQLRGMWR